LIGGKWEKGEIWIVPSLYNLSTGKVAFGDNLKMESRRTPTAAESTSKQEESSAEEPKKPARKYDPLDPPEEFPY
jgi:hypothetical protein